jgi:hypothetical protein
MPYVDQEKPDSKVIPNALHVASVFCFENSCNGSTSSAESMNPRMKFNAFLNTKVDNSSTRILWNLFGSSFGIKQRIPIANANRLSCPVNAS